jgi:hypothetical protein
MALTVAPLTTTVMSSVPTHQAGVASGINNAVSRVAGLLGVAVMAILIFLAFDQALTERLGRLDLPAGIQQALMNSALIWRRLKFPLRQILSFGLLLSKRSKRLMSPVSGG